MLSLFEKLSANVFAFSEKSDTFLLHNISFSYFSVEIIFQVHLCRTVESTPASQEFFVASRAKSPSWQSRLGETIRSSV